VYLGKIVDERTGEALRHRLAARAGGVGADTLSHGCIFDIWEPFYAKSDRVSAALTHIFIGAVNAWHKPLLFLISFLSS
jgi:hypothetical protein